MLGVAFWMLLGIGVYPYLIYPICLWVLGRLLGERVHGARSNDNCSVTVIIAAYNEADHIRSTVLNKLGLSAHGGELSVIVISDGSDDGTDDIVQDIASRDSRVRLIRQSPRQGKTAALNLAVEATDAEILVFSDANSIYRQDALIHLVGRFADDEVGYVTGSMRYTNPDGSLVGDGCSAYMRYENFLRAGESRIGSVVGVDGGIDAVRRSLYRPMNADQLPDFVLPLQVVEQGFRVVYEPQAVLHEDSLSSTEDEYRMRVRVALRAFWALWQKRTLLNPLRYPLFSWQLLSHKVLRYLSFAPLAGAAFLNWILIDRSPLYVVCAAAQLLFWIAVVGASGPSCLARNPIVRYCRYFWLLNHACAVAFAKFIGGRKQVIWQPRRG